MSTHNLSGIIFFAHDKRFENLIQFLWYFFGQDKRFQNSIKLNFILFFQTRQEVLKLNPSATIFF